jgi:hypothetical protein
MTEPRDVFKVLGVLNQRRLKGEWIRLCLLGRVDRRRFSKHGRNSFTWFRLGSPSSGKDDI